MAFVNYLVHPSFGLMCQYSKEKEVRGRDILPWTQELRRTERNDHALHLKLLLNCTIPVHSRVCLLNFFRAT